MSKFEQRGAFGMPTSNSCGGASICEQSRIRSKCKECGGSIDCEHGRQRNLCLLAQEEAPFSELAPSVRNVLSDHEACLRELGIISSNLEGEDKNLPVSWDKKQVGIGLSASAKLSQIAYTVDHSLATDEVFPTGKMDADLQQVDLRKTNSWRLKLGEINTNEMLEVQLVNSVAPFVLCNRLVHLMKKEDTGMKHIINVSAMEGKFHKYHKEARHPHTNMAKAAMNMMTLTSAGDFAKYGIYTNAVDTGWPPMRAREQESSSHRKRQTTTPRYSIRAFHFVKKT